MTDEFFAVATREIHKGTAMVTATATATATTMATATATEGTCRGMWWISEGESTVGSTLLPDNLGILVRATTMGKTHPPK